MIGIPFKDMELDSICLENIETGEKHSMNGVSGVNIESNSVYEYNKSYEMPVRTSFDASMEIEFSSNCEVNQVNQEVLNKVIGIDESKLPDKYDVQISELIQKRKHKKKRINKKWAKRYGYKQIMRKIKGWKIKTYCEDNTFELVKDGDSV